MALCVDCGAQIYYTVSGSTDTFTFPFQYTVPDDINVAVLDPATGEYVDLDRSDWTFENLTTIRTKTAPQQDLVIYRCTNISQPAAEFFPGNSIKAEDLNANQRQVLQAIEELRCAIAQCCTGEGGPTDPELPGPGEPCDDGQCAPGLICVDGICLPECDDGVCPDGYTCVEGICLPDCTEEADCPDGFTCVEGVCLPECDDDGVCPSGFVCVEGICLPDCSDDGECPDGYVCVNGICLPDCSDDGICPDGFICDDGICKPDCTDDGICPEGFECIDGICQPIDDGCDEGDAPSDGNLYGFDGCNWTQGIKYDFKLLEELVLEPVTLLADEVGETSTLPIIDAPSDGVYYGRQDADWKPALLYNYGELEIIPSPDPDNATTGTNSYNTVEPTVIDISPADGFVYGRKDAAWAKLTPFFIDTLETLPPKT